MIVFDLRCDASHRFEAWFASSRAYEDQLARDLIACPTCGSARIGKAVTAARLNGTGSSSAVGSGGGSPGEGDRVREMFGAVAAAQARALEKSEWVGEDFACRARELHEADPSGGGHVIHGKATPEDARALARDGVPVMPLLVPVVPPEQRN